MDQHLFQKTTATPMNIPILTTKSRSLATALVKALPGLTQHAAALQTAAGAGKTKYLVCLVGTVPEAEVRAVARVASALKGLAAVRRAARWTAEATLQETFQKQTLAAPYKKAWEAGKAAVAPPLQGFYARVTKTGSNFSWTITHNGQSHKGFAYPTDAEAADALRAAKQKYLETWNKSKRKKRKSALTGKTYTQL